MTLTNTFTSTGHKFFAHQEVMKNLRNKKGQPIVTHVMLTDVCNHSCAFCSVQARAGDSLNYNDVLAYLDILISFGLKAAILSGGGNPILYKCKDTGKTFNDVVDAIHQRGLEIGLITNGMPLKEYADQRKSWLTVWPETLDKITWIRISMAGLDHQEREVYVPDIDYEKTTLGFSYVGHDVYTEPLDPHHGKVSTKNDLITIGSEREEIIEHAWTFNDRMQELTEQIANYVEKYQPTYVRLLPNCLEPSLIANRVTKLESMAAKINARFAGSDIGTPVFVQHKPPQAPKSCYLGYVHPVLNCDGYVYPCDSCVLNDAAGHSFANPWRICYWSEVAKLYEQPVRSLIADPKVTCPGCVFSLSNKILNGVVDGSADLTPPVETPTHVKFV